jgi:hypothetical protein
MAKALASLEYRSTGRYEAQGVPDASSQQPEISSNQVSRFWVRLTILTSKINISINLYID